jgi:hypothetical protein
MGSQNSSLKLINIGSMSIGDRNKSIYGTFVRKNRWSNSKNNRKTLRKITCKLI